MHSVMTAVFTGHECIPIEQLQNIRSEELVPKHPEPQKCGIHGEQLKIFCFDCNKLICRDCTVKDHRDHNIEFNKVAADNKKKELTETLKPLQKVEESLSQALATVAKAESEIQTQEKEAANKIETSFKKLHEILDVHKKQLMEEIKRITEESIEKLAIQKKKLSNSSGEVRSVIDHTEQCVRLCSDDEVMSMHSEVTNRIQAQIRECCKQDTNFVEIPEKADITVEVDCTDALIQFCQKNIGIMNRKMSDMFEVKVPKTMEANREVKFTVCNKSDTRIPAKYMKCHIRCFGTREVFAVPTNCISHNKYDITYMPTDRGCYKLEVSAFGHPLPGSPFTMTTYLCPTQLNKPIKIWSTANSFAIAINSHDEIIVTTGNSLVVVFNKKGKKIRSTDAKSLAVDDLRKVAIDHEDNIYYIGEMTSQIGKCDRYFNNIQVRNVRKGKRVNIYDIAVVGDRVLTTLATETKNNGQITVYNRDLKFVRLIATGCKATLIYFCPDSHGNLYVSTGDSVIVVINLNGDILHSFNQVQNGVEVFANPWMVHVYGHYVYVADFDLQETVVFTTEGKYITTFGHFGPLCVDTGGLLFNCDRAKRCVCIY